MKNLLFIILLAPALTAQDISLDKITQAIGQGNAQSLAQYFDETVEVAILDSEDVYDKAEAQKVVAGFFSKHDLKSYNQVHQGVSKKEDSQYSIGKLVAADDTFRVYVYIKIEDGRHVIQELRFDKE